MVGCKKSNVFKYESNKITKIELYSLNETNYILDSKLTDNVDISSVLNKFEDLTFTSYLGDIKAKSNFKIRIYHDDNDYHEFDGYRILIYKSGKLEKTWKYKTDFESFKTLYKFALESFPVLEE